MPFQLFMGMFFLVFVLVLITIIVSLVRSVAQWSKNNASPRLTVDALVVAKRTEVHTYHHSGAGGTAAHHGSSTSYYVTFQVASGDRMELSLKGGEYGLLAEGDRGRLSFQGTRYLGFERL